MQGERECSGPMTQAPTAPRWAAGRRSPSSLFPAGPARTNSFRIDGRSAKPEAPALCGRDDTRVSGRRTAPSDKINAVNETLIT
jgi:hypothetical protein